MNWGRLDLSRAHLLMICSFNADTRVVGDNPLINAYSPPIPFINTSKVDILCAWVLAIEIGQICLF